MYKNTNEVFINLFFMVELLLTNVEKLKGDIPRTEYIEEEIFYLLENSIVEYNSKGLFLREFSIIGVRDILNAVVLR